MGAWCHSSINPWDDDIDVTAHSCAPLYELLENGKDVSDVYPELAPLNNRKLWKPKLIDDGSKQWMIAKGPRDWPHFKLKSVAQQMNEPMEEDFRGLDIMCFEDVLTQNEKIAMNQSGFREYRDENPLEEVEFGPITATIVPFDISKQYIKERYIKEDFCSFPFGSDPIEPRVASNPLNKDVSVDAPSPYWQLEDALSKWYFPHHKRKLWLSLVGKMDGNKLTQEAVTNLDLVEIDNTIAPPEGCKAMMTPGRALHVVGWNAERGKYWNLFGHQLLSGMDIPDVILLNEMDLGMARSGNMHTAQRLALQLGMNYAWGIEFIELTNGNSEEQKSTYGQKNHLGLHGNAMLSKCPIYDAKLFRDPLDKEYFSTKPHWKNAQGTEKRLGGRMGIFARTGPLPDGKDVSYSPHFVVGSVHKLIPRKQELQDYIVGTNNTHDKNQVLGVIAAGDIVHEFCPEAGLQNLDDAKKHRTFPANCKKGSLGSFRGDRFCGNGVRIVKEDESILPCFNLTMSPVRNKSSPFELIEMSDHSIIQVFLVPDAQNESSSFLS
ncbi:MAG: hypothetical protein SGARI_000028 [Bacillariaceae sp.]